MFNIWLYLLAGMFSIFFAIIAVTSDGAAISEGGFFQGYTWTTWGVVLIQVRQIDYWNR